MCRQVWARQAPLVHEGTYYTMPLPPGQGTGLGKALKIIAHPVRPAIPVWVAALGEKNVAMTAELADGWIPMLFMPEKARDVWGGALDAGRAKRDPSLGTLQITTGGLLAIGEGDEVTRLRDLGRARRRPVHRRHGGQGEELLQRRGPPVRVRAGGRGDPGPLSQRQEVRGRGTASPPSFWRHTSLCGPESYVAERIAAYREAGVTHLQVAPVPVGDQRPVDLIAKVKELAG